MPQRSIRLPLFGLNKAEWRTREARTHVAVIDAA